MTSHRFSFEEFQQRFLNDIFPPDWKNPKPSEPYDLVVIGGGPGGMTATMHARRLEAKVALVEKAHLGGECLSYGCIPSKAFLRSSRLAAEIYDAKEFGIDIPKGWKVDFGAVIERVRRKQMIISPHDSAEHFKQLGADIFLGLGRFVGSNQLQVGHQILTFKKAIIATGTEPVYLTIPGLENSDYLTNENVFTLTQLPRRLMVIGAGPIGCELAQAFSRFGSEVSLITRGATLLPKDDPLAAERLLNVFRKEKLQIFFQSQIARIEKRGKEKIIYLDNRTEGIVVDEILVAIGRIPAIEGLDLDKAGIAFDRQKGIIVNDFLQTSNSAIYASGDVSSHYKFTHASKELAKIAVENALNGTMAKSSSLIIPWCTYTDPEIAHVGLSEKEIQEKEIPIETALVQMQDVDRAILDGETIGFAKLLIKANSDQIVGATLMARHAGDLISEITVAMTHEHGLKALASAIHPFPTQAQIIRSAAESLMLQRISHKSKLKV